MSVLIKNLQIPKNEYIDVRIFSDGTASTPTNENPYYRNLEVIELPTPHGRLIDADEVKKHKKHSDEFAENIVAVFYIDRTSTVIEAEE